jgi:hypothetical protein
MGCGNSNLLDNDELKIKLEKRKNNYAIHEEHWNRIYEVSDVIKKRVTEIVTLKDIDALWIDEGRNIYEVDLSKEQGRNAIYTLAAKEFLLRNLIKNANIDRFIKDEFLILQTCEVEEIPDIEEIIDKIEFTKHADITTYNGYLYEEVFLPYVIDNLKYNKQFHLENCFLYLTKRDIQTSKRMIDLGEFIDFNDPIKNLVVFLEPIRPVDYNHSMSKNQEYISNCSNLSFFFDAINKSDTLENIGFICNQRVLMKFTQECVEKFFSKFINLESRLQSLALINIDIQDNDLFRFKEVFKHSKIKIFIYQPPWPTDFILREITNHICISKTLELVVFFDGRKCSEEQLEASKINLLKVENIKKVYFEDNFYYQRSLKNK